jgi:hypothetical protein
MSNNLKIILSTDFILPKEAKYLSKVKIYSCFESYIF